MVCVYLQCRYSVRNEGCRMWYVYIYNVATVYIMRAVGCGL